jgi:hypothetical protein
MTNYLKILIFEVMPEETRETLITSIKHFFRALWFLSKLCMFVLGVTGVVLLAEYSLWTLLGTIPVIGFIICFLIAKFEI